MEQGQLGLSGRIRTQYNKLMKINPFGFNILIKPIEKKQILVSDQPSLCEYGEVIAVGNKVTEIKVGDTIGYTVFGINSLEIDGTKHYFVPETSEFILGTIELDQV